LSVHQYTSHNAAGKYRRFVSGHGRKARGFRWEKICALFVLIAAPSSSAGGAKEFSPGAEALGKLSRNEYEPRQGGTSDVRSVELRAAFSLFTQLPNYSFTKLS
jgi:hypothetical protein